MITLVVQDKGGAIKRHQFPKDEATIGRMHSGNDIVLAAPNVSKHHAKLYRKEGRLVVEDLKSTCGTYVNGIKVSGVHPLGPTDKVYVGDFILEFEEPDEDNEELEADDLEPAAGPAGRPAPLPPPSSVAQTTALPIINVAGSGPVPITAVRGDPGPVSGQVRLPSGPYMMPPAGPPRPAPGQEALYTALSSLTVAVEALYRMVLDERQKPPMSIRAAAAIEETRNALQRYQKEKNG